MNSIPCSIPWYLIAGIFSSLSELKADALSEKYVLVLVWLRLGKKISKFQVPILLRNIYTLNWVGRLKTLQRFPKPRSFAAMKKSQNGISRRAGSFVFWRQEQYFEPKYHRFHISGVPRILKMRKNSEISRLDGKSEKWDSVIFIFRKSMLPPPPPRHQKKIFIDKNDIIFFIIFIKLPFILYLDSWHHLCLFKWFFQAINAQFLHKIYSIHLSIRELYFPKRNYYDSYITQNQSSRACGVQIHNLRKINFFSSIYLLYLTLV